MSFNGTRELTIAGSATNVVHGDQHNSNKVIHVRIQRGVRRVGRQPRLQPEPEKDAELDMIHEVSKPLNSDCDKILNRDFGSSIINFVGGISTRSMRSVQDMSTLQKKTRTDNFGDMRGAGYSTVSSFEEATGHILL
jgi:hypothetical protein